MLLILLEPDRVLARPDHTWKGICSVIEILTQHTCSIPCNILPPATPPLRSSTSQPGLFTSNDLITMETKA